MQIWVNKLHSFTLAEILVTLTVIGIVASMTIPGLVNKINDAEYKSAWKNTYAVLAQAAKNATQDEGGNLSGTFYEGLGHGADQLRDKFKPHLKYTKLCSVTVGTGTEGCWHNSTSFFKLSGESFGENWSNYSRLILTNGALVVFKLTDKNCDYVFSSTGEKDCGWIYADVNGFKKPNTIGKDIFALHVKKDGSVIPFGSQNDWFSGWMPGNGCDLTKYPDSTGWVCSTDYLTN